MAVSPGPTMTLLPSMRRQCSNPLGTLQHIDIKTHTRRAGLGRPTFLLHPNKPFAADTHRLAALTRDEQMRCCMIDASTSYRCMGRRFTILPSHITSLGLRTTSFPMIPLISYVLGLFSSCCFSERVGIAAYTWPGPSISDHLHCVWRHR